MNTNRDGLAIGDDFHEDRQHNIHKEEVSWFDTVAGKGLVIIQGSIAESEGHVFTVKVVLVMDFCLHCSDRVRDDNPINAGVGV